MKIKLSLTDGSSGLRLHCKYRAVTITVRIDEFRFLVCVNYLKLVEASASSLFGFLTFFFLTAGMLCLRLQLMPNLMLLVQE